MAVKLPVTIAVVLAAAVGAYAMHAAHTDAPGIRDLWRRAVVPGEFSASHADLAQQCDACHSPVLGVERDKCAGCHANESAVLSRQPTAFHADVQICTGCHVEHRGGGAMPTLMDHGLLARHGLDELRIQDPGERDALLRLVRTLAGNGQALGQNPDVPPVEAALACESCHLNDDRHWGLFGKDCVTCHETGAWSLAAFRHPQPSSSECSQCHQAPPSHYMMHFKMVSAKVAGQPHAPVAECYVCHQTTSWNDIKRVGVYKHH